MGSTQNCGLHFSVVASRLATQGLDSWLCFCDISTRCLVVPPYSCCNKATQVQVGCDMLCFSSSSSSSSCSEKQERCNIAQMLTCRLKVYLDLSPGGPPCPDAAHAAAQRTKVVTSYFALVCLLVKCHFMRNCCAAQQILKICML